MRQNSLQLDSRSFIDQLKLPALLLGVVFMLISVGCSPDKPVTLPNHPAEVTKTPDVKPVDPQPKSDGNAEKVNPAEAAPEKKKSTAKADPKEPVENADAKTDKEAEKINPAHAKPEELLVKPKKNRRTNGLNARRETGLRTRASIPSDEV